MRRRQGWRLLSNSAEDGDNTSNRCKIATVNMLVFDLVYDSSSWSSTLPTIINLIGEDVFNVFYGFYKLV
jgi:hypothetical protein